MRRLPRALLPTLLAACAGSGGSDGAVPGGPDLAAPLLLRAAAYDGVKMSLTDLADGDVIDLVRPPQGGYVLFAGVRVHGLTSPAVQLSGGLTSAAGKLIGRESHTAVLVADPQDATGWIADPRSYLSVANIPVCPVLDGTTAESAPARLDLTVTELVSGRTGTATLQVRPQCRQADPAEASLCRCACDHTLPPDAGCAR